MPVPIDEYTIYVDGNTYIVNTNQTWAWNIENKSSTLSEFSVSSSNAILYKEKVLYRNGTAVASTDNPFVGGVYTTIADLTGTKWVINNSIYITQNISYNVNCSYDGYNFETIDFQYYTADNKTWKALLLDGNYEIVQATAQENPIDNLYGNQILEITGGTDATNPSLITWLSQNAELQVEPQANVYELTHSLTNLSHGNISIQITPDAGYTYPPSVTVTNGTLVSYDSATGVAVVSGDDNTVVNAECAEAALIDFSIVLSGTTYSYQAEMDMTWTDFANSSYNLNNDVITNDFTVAFKTTHAQVYTDSSLRFNVDPTDTITANFTYYAGQGN